MTKRRMHAEPIKRWSADEIALLRALYPNTPTSGIAARLGKPIQNVYQAAARYGLKKSDEYMASPAACRLRRGDNIGAAYRFKKGHVSFNKGLRRPGWAPGRMAETQFKKGQFPVNKDPEFYVPGALRVNSDGYIEMRTSFDLGSLGWTSLARVLWEDAHGPVPKGYALKFKDGDTLNVELPNLELISRADLMRRNTIHNYPPPLKSAIRLLKKVKRAISEKQDRGSAQPPVRDA